MQINKRSAYITSIFMVVMMFWLAAPILAFEHPNFNGVWVLNKTKSSNLPNIFETVDEYLLIIKQSDDKSITVSTEFRGRGQTISSEPDTFSLDGNAVEKEDRRGFKLKRSFRFGENQKLLVETEKQFTGEVQLPNSNESETWELTDAGQTLTITITPKSDGSQKQVRVFSKKS